jgi:iron complex outermembrane receptor protein
MRSAALIALLLVAAQSPGQAAGRRMEFDIPAGPISHSVLVLGRQAGVTIGVFGEPIDNVRSRRLKGRYSITEALRRVLQDSGYDFRRLPGGEILIVRRTARPRPQPAPKVAVTEDQSDIIVTSSKRGSPLSNYPAAVVIMEVDPRAGPASLTDGTNAIVDQVPVMASTYLGPGRNKLFIQGIADSSFNGYSTATVAQYLGDIRLTYNAPDPNLNLYDIKRVEVLEGPQATLYGAGSLGGILRLVPNDPDTGQMEGSLAAGFIDTRHGANGGDIAGMLNIPIVTDQFAIRAVGYHQVQPGYIDDSYRGLKDINRVLVSGGRMMARIEAGDDWTIELGGVVQTIDSRDSQYAVTGLPPLTQIANGAQPFHNDYYLAHLIVRKKFDNFDLISATSFVRESALEVQNAKDAIFPGFPSRLYDDSKISMVSNETRISGEAGSVSFIGGISSSFFNGLYDYRDVASPSGPLASLVDLTAVDNRITNVAAFGEVEIGLPKNLSVTMGGRIEYADTTSRERLSSSFDEDGITFYDVVGSDSRTDLHVLPSIALSWKPFRKMLAFARYQRGFRPGGFQPALVGTEETPTLRLVRYPSDHIGSAQLGFRYGSTAHAPFSMSMTLSHTNWSAIQSDFPSTEGVPAPVNGGDAVIDGVEAAMTIRPVRLLELQGAIFANVIKRTSRELAKSLPSIPGVGVAASVSYGFSPLKGADLTFRAALRYTGKTQAELFSTQPAYTMVNVSTRLSVGRYGVSLEVTNIGDVRGNRFSLGNPLGRTEGLQTTPLRPRSIRLGFDAIF